jgi:hypothetical protein
MYWISCTQWAYKSAVYVPGGIRAETSTGGTVSDVVVNAVANAVVNAVLPGGRLEASEESFVAFSFIVGLEGNEDVVGAMGAFSGNGKEKVG